MTQQLIFTQPELLFAELDIKLTITQLLKHNAEMLFMLFLTLRKNQDVINEDHDKHVQLFHENRDHQEHEVSGGIGHPKGHHQILIETVPSGESSL
jgi:hypothetical protein